MKLVWILTFLFLSSCSSNANEIAVENDNNFPYNFENQKTNHYFLTEKGLSLTPVIIELALWSHHNIKPVDNQDIANVKDKNELHLAIIERYKSKTVTL